MRSSFGSSSPSEQSERNHQAADRHFSLASRPSSAVSLALAILTTGILAVAARSLVHSGWPFANANPALLAATALLFLLAYGFKAYGWRRLFRAFERPGPFALAAAGGGASIMGVALPGRFDEMIRVAIVRRYPGCRVSVRGVRLTLVTLGLIDTVALAPLAIAAAEAFLGNSPAVRAGFAVVGIGGVGAALVVLALPRLSARRSLAKFRIVGWLAPRATPWREAAWAWVSSSRPGSSESSRSSSCSTPSESASRSPAIMFICAGAASAAIPIGPAGAATQITAGTTLLVVSGIDAPQALGFALAAQALLIFSGASIFLAGSSGVERERVVVEAWTRRPPQPDQRLALA